MRSYRGIATLVEARRLRQTPARHPS